MCLRLRVCLIFFAKALRSTGEREGIPITKEKWNSGSHSALRKRIEKISRLFFNASSVQNGNGAIIQGTSTLSKFSRQQSTEHACGSHSCKVTYQACPLSTVRVDKKFNVIWLKLCDWHKSTSAVRNNTRRGRLQFFTGQKYLLSEKLSPIKSFCD